VAGDFAGYYESMLIACDETNERTSSAEALVAFLAATLSSLLREMTIHILNLTSRVSENLFGGFSGVGCGSATFEHQAETSDSIPFTGRTAR
jgi:hypothetical protein